MWNDEARAEGGWEVLLESIDFLNERTGRVQKELHHPPTLISQHEGDGQSHNFSSTCAALMNAGNGKSRFSTCNDEPNAVTAIGQRKKSESKFRRCPEW